MCKEHVKWVMTDYLIDLLARNKKDPADFHFKVCMDQDGDRDKRAFPWMHSTTSDWQYDLLSQGSVVLHPEDLVDVWMGGFQQSMPDALEYFARMGEVAGQKIIPKFMLYGWSKGAMAIWPLGRWRSDIVQAVVVVHGCDYPKMYDKTHYKKANGDMMSPYLFFSSKRDGYLTCTENDSLSRYQKQKKYQPLTYHAETPCGHHPERCWPLCDYNKTYVTPFWDFVNVSYTYQACIHVKDQQQCEADLCMWDADLGVCAEAHPTRFTPTCAKFCSLELVDSCSGLVEEACAKSYRLVPEEEAQAKGMHSQCQFAGGTCTSSASSAQCFFQDQCEVEAAAAKDTTVEKFNVIYA